MELKFGNSSAILEMVANFIISNAELYISRCFRILHNIFRLFFILYVIFEKSFIYKL